MPAATTWRGLPCLQLTATPTPLDRAERLSDHLGVEILLKRDDAGPLGVAGNKVRKLELLLAEAVQGGADAVVIIGARQSNAARATAACAARLGLACHLVVDGDPGDEEPEPEGNLLLDRLFGATVHPAARATGPRSTPARRAGGRAARAGATPYRMPVGALLAARALGFARAYEELPAAGRPVEAIYHASSSGGTHAGLLAGARSRRERGPHPRGSTSRQWPDMAG
jgi:1-aminocyclopropane-1-carboxylate deaminase/D-cysteine desulfhydrase-like pyridoxal-dependent ACC family enzyme